MPTIEFRLRSLVAVLLSLLCVSALAAEEPAKALLDFSQPQTIVCFGDSVTGVYYHTGGWRAYPEMLEIGLKKLHPEGKITVINAGISGHTTENGLARIDKDVLEKKPTLVTVTFGLNDMTRVPLETYEKNLREIVARCRAINAQVVLCTPNAVIDTGDRPRAKLELYCEGLRKVAKELNAPVCDQYAAGEAQRKGDAWKWRLTLSDAIHPNMAGHKLMAEELCKTIAGRSASLADVSPPSPALKKTLALLKEKKPVRVLAMTPYDKLILPALQQIDPDANVEVTVWETAGKTVEQLELEAKTDVRKLAPNLVLLAVPREAVDAGDESFVKSYSWIMNWSLSFGYQEWDCLVIHPAVAAPETKGPRDDLVRTLVHAQHLYLVDRAADDKASAAELLARWIKADAK